VQVNTRHATRREEAFTLVEVLVALFVIALITTAATLMFNSSSQALNRTKITDRQHAVAAGVVDRAMSNTKWIDTFGCRGQVGRCTAAEAGFIRSDDELLAERDGIIEHDVALVIDGIDLPNDGLATDAGAARDLIVPDVYRITVTANVVAPPDLGTFQPYTLTADLNMSVRAGTGTLRLRTCSIGPQLDERLGTGMCAKGGSETFDVQGPTSCPVNNFDCDAWNAARAADAATYTRVTVAPLPSVGYELVGPLPDEPSSRRAIATGANGMVEVTGLKPGQYKLENASPPGGAAQWRTWSTHSVPSGGYVTVSVGEVAEAAQLFVRTPTKPVEVSVVTHDVTDPANPVDRAGATDEVSFKLVPVPSGRSLLAQGANDGWTVAGAGAATVEVTGATPGLYSASVLNYPGTFASPLAISNRFVWIDEDGDSLEPLVLRQTECDPVRRHAIVVARCGDWRRWCTIGGVWHGECGDSPESGGGPAVTGTPGA
jgi:type II secretory pathway pseudopilin PulG